MCETELPFHSFSSCDWSIASSDEHVEDRRLDREIKNQLLSLSGTFSIFSALKQ